MIKEVHSMGHFGVSKMKATNEGTMGKWWPTMRRDLTVALQQCQACMQHNVIEYGYHPSRAVNANEPFAVVAMDL